MPAPSSTRRSRASRTTRKPSCSRRCSIADAARQHRPRPACEPSWPTSSRTWPTRAQAWYELAQLLDDAEQYDDGVRGPRRRQSDSSRRTPLPTAQQNQMTLERNQPAHRCARQIACTSDGASCAASDYALPLRRAHQPSPQRHDARRAGARQPRPADQRRRVRRVHAMDLSADRAEVSVFGTPLLSILDNVPPAVRQQARATYWKQTEAIFDEPIGERMLLDKNPGMMILLPVINWAFPGNENADRAARPARRRAELLHAEGAAHADQLELAGAGRRGRVLRPRRCKPGWRSAALTTRPVARIPLRRRGGRPGSARPARSWNSSACRGTKRCSKFYEHAREKIVRSPTYKDVTQPVYHKSVGRWQHYARHFEPIFETLQPYVKEFGYTE